MPDWRYVELPGCARFDGRWFRNNYVPGRTWVQAKLDGHRRVLYKGQDGRIHAYGRRESTVTFQKEDCIDRLGPWVRSLAESLPRGCGVDGEAYVPGGTSENVPTLMKADSKDLRYAAFGVLFLEDSYSRRSLYEDAQFCHALNLPWVLSFDTEGKAWDEATMANWLADLRSQYRTEGWVLKNQAWGPMAKFKPMETYDVVVTGATAGMGKYAGQIGALTFACYGEDGRLREIGRCSGMTDDQRAEFTRRVPVGEVIEVSAQGLAGRGRLRHPQFKRMRPDKNPRECLLPRRQNG